MARQARLLTPLLQDNPDRPSRKWAVYYRKVVMRPRDPKKPTEGECRAFKTDRAFFPDEATARRFISEKQDEADTLGAGALILTDSIKREALECLEKLRAFVGRDGKTPTLSDAVAVYIREERLAESDKKVGQAVRECLSAKQKEGKGLRYLQQFEINLRKFTKRFGDRPLGSVKDYEIEKWLDDQYKGGKGLAPTTRNNLLTYVVAFYSWCVEEGRTAQHPALRIKYLKLRRHSDDDSSQGRLLTPDQLKLILADCPDDFRPTLCLLAFAGVRCAEMARLRWTHLKNDSTTLYLNRGITKTDEGRTTPIPKAVARYLERHRPEEGDDGFIFKGCRDDAVKGLSDAEEARRDVNRVTRLNVRLNRLKKSVRKHFPWPSNALRASALSYRVQLTGSTDRTAEEMGNSKTILKRTYQELTTEAEAKEWFATDPKEYPYGSTDLVSAFIQGKARGMKFARNWMKELEAKKAVEEEEAYDEPLTDDEEGEAVEGEANHGLNVTTEDTLPAYLNPKKAKLFSKRKGKK
jgi:integrase